MLGRPIYYRLDAEIGEGRVPIPVDDILEWGKWFETDEATLARCVGRTVVGLVEVSTIFLGLCHQFSEAGPPILFETLVFWVERDVEGFSHEATGYEMYGWRGVSWEDAAWNHIEVVREIEADDGVDSGLTEAIELRIAGLL